MSFNIIWDIVIPQICEFLKARKIRYSAIKAARFVTHGEDGKDTLGPIVIWIAAHPATTTAKNAHSASPPAQHIYLPDSVDSSARPR